MVTQVDFLQQTFAKITGGAVGTAPDFFVASSDQTAAVITTAGAIADMRASGLVKVMDIIWVNGDMDGTPFQNVYTVTATSGGSLTPYTEGVGGALLAANNLSDVNSVPDARDNLVLGATDLVNFGGLELGSATGGAGVFAIFPTTGSSGAIQVQAADNAGDFVILITNSSYGQNTSLTIPDVGAATGSFLMSPLAVADINSNIISFDITVGQGDMAAGASAILFSATALAQYKIRGLWANRGGTNFSGGGGDRLAAITDNTTVYSLIPAASLQTLANARWGDTALPFPASAAINVSTAAGQNLVMKYSGGAADYTAGSVVISGLLERVV